MLRQNGASICVHIQPRFLKILLSIVDDTNFKWPFIVHLCCQKTSQYPPVKFMKNRRFGPWGQYIPEGQLKPKILLQSKLLTLMAQAALALNRLIKCRNVLQNFPNICRSIFPIFVAAIFAREIGVKSVASQREGWLWEFARSGRATLKITPAVRLCVNHCSILVIFWVI